MNYCNGKLRKDYEEVVKCPRCNDYLPIGYPGAISRRDDMTEICSECGVREALEDIIKYWKGVKNETR